MRTQMKSEYLHIRIERGLKVALLKYCQDNDMTPSKVIRSLITKKIHYDIDK